MKQNPCYKCIQKKKKAVSQEGWTKSKGRALGCHGHCKEYKQWANYNGEVKHNRRMSKETTDYSGRQKLKNKIERERY